MCVMNRRVMLHNTKMIHIYSVGCCCFVFIKFISGVFHPRCDVDGYYKTEQCHEHVCWCVDRYGREFDRSRSIGKMPDCGQYGKLVCIVYYDNCVYSASTIDDDTIDHFNLIGEL